MPIYTKNNNIIKLSGIYVGNSSKNPIQISKVYRGDSNGTPILVYSSHTHSYGTTHTKESTGVYYVTCSCGAKKYCDVKYRSAISATCTSKGHTAGYYCYDHYTWLTGSSIPALGHDYKYTPDPDDNYRHIITCTRCDYSDTGFCDLPAGDICYDITCICGRVSEGDHVENVIPRYYSNVLHEYYCTKCSTQLRLESHADSKKGYTKFTNKQHYCTCYYCAEKYVVNCTWEPEQPTSVGGACTWKCSKCGNEHTHTHSSTYGSCTNKLPDGSVCGLTYSH